MEVAGKEVRRQLQALKGGRLALMRDVAAEREGGDESQ